MISSSNIQPGSGAPSGREEPYMQPMDEVASEAVLDQAYACPGPAPGAGATFRLAP
jgi:hypothetical protein